MALERPNWVTMKLVATYASSVTISKMKHFGAHYLLVIIMLGTVAKAGS